MDTEAVQHRLGETIRDRREALGWTMSAAARSAGVHRLTWRAWEVGKSMPEPHNYMRIERALMWAPNTVKAVLRGGNPRILADSDSSYRTNRDQRQVEHSKHVSAAEKTANKLAKSGSTDSFYVAISLIDKLRDDQRETVGAMLYLPTLIRQRAEVDVDLARTHDRLRRSWMAMRNLELEMDEARHEGAPDDFIARLDGKRMVMGELVNEYDEQVTRHIHQRVELDERIEHANNLRALYSQNPPSPSESTNEVPWNGEH